MSESSPTVTLTLLHCLVQNVHACIKLNHIMRILPLPFLEVIPGCPDYLAGLMNLAGHSIPVIDLSMRLGMYRLKPYALDIPVLLCCEGSQQVGILVDEVLGLIAMDESALQMRNEFAKDDSPFLAIVPVGAELSLCLNLSRIIAFRFTTTESDFTVDKHLLHKAKKHHE